MARLIFEIPPIKRPNSDQDISSAYAVELACWYENEGAKQLMEWFANMAMDGNLVAVDGNYPGGPIQGQGNDIIVYLKGDPYE